MNLEKQVDKNWEKRIVENIVGKKGELQLPPKDVVKPTNRGYPKYEEEEDD